MPGIATRSDLTALTIVLDASAAVEVALWTDRGASLAQHIAPARETVVPDHFHLEAAAATRRLEVRDEISAQESRRLFEHLIAMRTRRVDTLPLLREVWKMRHNVTVGDALYVVLARRLQVPLVPGDARLARSPDLGVEVLTSPS